MANLIRNKSIVIASLAICTISLHLVLKFLFLFPDTVVNFPLIFALAIGGIPLVFELARHALKGEFGADLLGGISIVTSLVMGEYLAGAIIVLMLSGGEALESFALRNASSVLEALSKRMPSIAHLKLGSSTQDISLDQININDQLVVYPHEICPVDGVVVEGRSEMDESYLTGEPFRITKTIGSAVISGAVNGNSVLVISASKLPVDSRYAKIMRVMKESESQRPRMRRLGDQLGAFYTPLALTVAALAWWFSGESLRFLAVLVIATPCPLLLGIPIAIIGSISLAARRSIIVKSPVVLEQVGSCQTAIFDKTGTLTYGEPELTDNLVVQNFHTDELLGMVASLERFSKHPLSNAIMKAAESRKISLIEAENVSEVPGEGLRGRVAGHEIQIMSRKQLIQRNLAGAEDLPERAGGLECIVVVDGSYAATYRFRDTPRKESPSFIRHLGPEHQFKRVMIISGDRESEVRYLADQVGIKEIYAQKSPEEKLAIVREFTSQSKTLYLGDGINDAPAMMAATVGMAIGQNSDVTTEAAGVVILDNSLIKVDEFLHISRRMKSIALQSAVGGMFLSVLGMSFAATGHLSPVSGAILQEIIDVLAILNALRAAFPPKVMHDQI